MLFLIEGTIAILITKLRLVKRQECAWTIVFHLTSNSPTHELYNGILQIRHLKLLLLVSHMK